MVQLYLGKSSANNEHVAAAQAVAEAGELARHPVFALVFSTDQYDSDALAAALSQELGDVPWAGCCTAGVFVGTDFLDHGIAIGLFSARDLHVGVGLGGPLSSDPLEAGSRAAQEALAKLPPRQAGRSRVLMVLPDALTGNAAAVVRGASRIAGAGVHWAGGGAGDNLRFVRTAQFAHGLAWHDQVVVVALDSAGPIGTGIRHGWIPYGPPCTVTRACGATVLELDYQNAFEVYRSTAEDRGHTIDSETFSAFAMTHPLGIPQADGEYVIRDPLAVEPDGGLRCVAEVPEGCVVRIMEGDSGALLEASLDAARAARTGVAGTVGGAVIFDCVSRSLVLGSHASHERRAFQQGLGAKVPILGCLTFGEVGGLGAGVPQFHNKTAVVLALSSHEAASTRIQALTSHSEPSENRRP